MRASSSSIRLRVAASGYRGAGVDAVGVDSAGARLTAVAGAGALVVVGAAAGAAGGLLTAAFLVQAAPASAISVATAAVVIWFSLIGSFPLFLIIAAIRRRSIR